MGYETKKIGGVVIEDGKDVIVDITLNSAATSLETVELVATASKSSERSVLTLQKEANIAMDGLSIQAMKKAGSSVLADAVKNVPGVSVQEVSLFTFVDWVIGSTKTTLNGIDVPGLDPDRNTLQLDIFPTSILDNIAVIKSGSAEYSADFTGGIIDIVTKDLPVTKTFNVSAGLGYNSTMHFNDDYLSYGNSGTQFLGFDGDRDLPIQSGFRPPIPR